MFRVTGRGLHFQGLLLQPPNMGAAIIRGVSAGDVYHANRVIGTLRALGGVGGGARGP